MAKKADVQDAPGKVSYRERVAKREDLRRRAQLLREKCLAAIKVADDKEDIAARATGQVYSFKSTIEGVNRLNGRHHAEDVERMTPWEKDEFDKLQKAAADAKEVAAHARQHAQSTHQDLVNAEKELTNYGHSLGIEDLIQYQEDVAAAERTVAELQALISDQTSTIEKARQAVPESADDLLQEREDILAAISLGTATGKDLKALDEQIAAREAALEEFNKVAGNAKQIIAGLQRKLDAAENELTLLRSSRKEIINEFLMGQAELVGQEYIKLSIQLIDKFKELTALDEIMGSPARLSKEVRAEGFAIRRTGGDADRFAIPTFNLKAFEGLEDKHNYGQIAAVCSLSGPYKDRAVIQKAVDDIKAKYQTIGINL
ncbi:MAG: hypothetical protein OEW15_04850 [Nitrospirota bacterium]|nr:hypothetical protein [Nitrospirota bacterium]